MLEYRPTTGGNPASSAYASAVGISTAAIATPASRSGLSSESALGAAVSASADILCYLLIVRVAFLTDVFPEHLFGRELGDQASAKRKILVADFSIVVGIIPF